MKDGIPNGSGNSRFLKSVENFKTLYPTYDAFVAALVAGTLPIDLNGINPEGWEQIGDALGKYALLKDSTAEVLELSGAALPDDALRILSRFHSGLGNEYLWSKIASYNTIVTGTSVSNYMLVSASQTSATVQYADEVTLSGNEIVLINPATLAISLNNLSASTVLNNKYVKLVSTVASTAVIYCTYASGVDYSIQGKSVTVGIGGNVVGYVNSPNPNAYPPAVDDGFSYQALGMLGEKVRIATGSYTGTGRYGSSNKNSLTLNFEAKVIIIYKTTFQTAATPGTNWPGNWGSTFAILARGTTQMNVSSGSAAPTTTYLTWSGNTVTWYNDSTTTWDAPNVQWNASGEVYNYIALG